MDCSWIANWQENKTKKDQSRTAQLKLARYAAKKNLTPIERIDRDNIKYWINEQGVLA